MKNDLPSFEDIQKKLEREILPEIQKRGVQEADLAKLLAHMCAMALQTDSSNREHVRTIEAFKDMHGEHIIEYAESFYEDGKNMVRQFDDFLNFTVQRDPELGTKVQGVFDERMGGLWGNVFAMQISVESFLEETREEEDDRSSGR